MRGISFSAETLRLWNSFSSMYFMDDITNSLIPNISQVLLKPPRFGNLSISEAISIISFPFPSGQDAMLLDTSFSSSSLGIIDFQGMNFFCISLENSALLSISSDNGPAPIQKK